MKLSENPDEGDFFRRFVRLHAHDSRNHFNGIEMELMLLEMAADADSRKMIDRIRKELGALEVGLRSLENQITPPDIEVVSALDVFCQWKSKHCERDGSSVNWQESHDDVSIRVDMQVISDSLCEWLQSLKDPVMKITGELRDNEFCFGIEREGGLGETNVSKESLPPGVLRLVESNGGRFREESSSDGKSCLGLCCFKVVAGHAAC